MSKKKSNSKKPSKNKESESLDSLVTWVADPSHLNPPEEDLSDEITEVLELETLETVEESTESVESSSADSENLESDLDPSDVDSVETEETEDLDSQLDRISKLLHAQAEQDQSEEVAQAIQPSFDPEAELAQQIAEDQALEAALEGALSPEGGLEPALQAGTTMDVAEIQSCIEALLFISDKPLSMVKLQELLAPELNRELFQEALSYLCEKYQGVSHGIEIVEVGGGYQFRTKVGQATLAQKLAKVQTQRLSTGSMESLAIVAYKQPVMKEEIDKVRGVDSSYFIRGLLEKKLIRISGRSELPGRPVLYNTTQEFLELFGLKDLSSLPSLRELEEMIPHSQSNNPDDEDPKIRTMRRLVGEMNVDGSGALKYDPKEDDKLLKEFRERVTAIPSSTPYLDELKAAELLAKQQQQLALQEQALAQEHPPGTAGESQLSSKD